MYRVRPCDLARLACLHCLDGEAPYKIMTIDNSRGVLASSFHGFDLTQCALVQVFSIVQFWILSTIHPDL